MASNMEDPTVIHIQEKRPNWVNTIMSSLSKRVSSALFGISKNGKRNINEVFGYKEPGELDFPQLYWMYRRGGLAFRIVNGFARSCWRDGIKLVKDNDEILEDEIKVLNKHGKLIKRLEQADILNRIGKFSILFVGIPDGLDPDKPVGRVANKERLKEVYFRPYAEDGVTINSWNQDVTSPRFGLPETYNLQVVDRGEKDTSTISSTIVVHWTRVVHLSEGALDSDVEGISCLEPVFNTLEDLIKTSGGSAEAYFRNARNRFSMETDPKFSAAFTPDEKKALEEEAQRFQNEWQDFIRAGGIKINALNIPHASPADTFLVNLKVLAGTTGYPIRILTGEGAGQLAGNEDKESYNQIVQDRRDLWCTDWVMDIFSILEEAGLVELDEETEVQWPTPTVVSEKDKSTIASANSTALNNVALAVSSPGVDGQLSLEEALKLVFGEEAITDVEIEEVDDDVITQDDLDAAELDNMPDEDDVSDPEDE